MKKLMIISLLLITLGLFANEFNVLTFKIETFSGFEWP